MKEVPNGFINLLKPPGMTSSDAVVTVRRRLPKGTRVGHAGTLDPEAAGILPIMVGKAARLFDYLVDKEKTYLAGLKLGVVTDTRDAQGEALSRCEARPSDAEIEAVLPRFTGVIWQKPPAHSALKRDGKRLYELARAGQEVDVPARQVEVFALERTRRVSADEVLLTIRCGKGTYIRSICHDIGQALGCGAHMGFLLRAQSGVFALDNACTLVQLAATEDLSALLLPIDAPLGHMSRVAALPSARAACLSGSPLRAEQLSGPLPEENQPQCVYVGAEFVGIGHRAGDAVVFDAMLLERENL